MAEARLKDEWSRWSILLAMTRNANRGPGEPTVTAAQMNPYRDHEAEQAPRASIDLLKTLFLDGKKGRKGG